MIVVGGKEVFFNRLSITFSFFYIREQIIMQNLTKDFVKIEAL